MKNLMIKLKHFFSFSVQNDSPNTTIVNAENVLLPNLRESDGDEDDSPGSSFLDAFNGVFEK